MGMLMRLASTIVLTAQLALAKQIVLVDRSGSMLRYYESQTTHRLATQILQACDGTDQPMFAIFSTSIKPVSGIDDPAFAPETDPNSWTHLDLAVSYATMNGFDIAWILTDNIQHYAGHPEGKFLDRFYSHLRSDAVYSVVVFPIPQQPGVQGLVVYNLLLNPDKENQFNRQIEKFSQIARGTDGFRIKPLGRNTVEVVYPDGIPKAKRYSLGSRIRGQIRILFRSRFEHLVLSDAKITWDPVAQKKLKPGAALQIDRVNYRVDPCEVQTLSPGEVTGQGYFFSYDLGRLKLRPGIGAFLKAATTAAKENFDLVLPLYVEVLPHNLKLAKVFLDRYEARSAEEARRTGKVYGLAGLPLQICGNVVRCSTAVRVPLQADYGFGPALALTGIIVGLIAGTVLIAKKGIPALRALIGKRRVQLYAVISDGMVVPCAIDAETGKVEFYKVEIGKVDERGAFWPAPGFIIEDGQKAVPIKRDTRFNLKKPDGTVLVLVANGKASAGAVTKPKEPPTPLAVSGESEKPHRRWRT